MYGCVAQTALGAVRDGFEVTIVREAAIGRVSERTLDIRARLYEAGVRWASLAQFLAGREAAARVD